MEKACSNELVSLHDLNGKGGDAFLLEGTVCFGQGQQRYIQRVPFETLSIGSYEDETLHTVGQEIWLQSLAAKGASVWYRLKKPASEYARYYEPFLWLADLAKHLIDYLHTHERVDLHDFRSTFSMWLQTVHGSDRAFLQWQARHPKEDYRHIIVAHTNFLWNQVGQLGPQYTSHPLWRGIDSAALTAIPRQPLNRQDSRTVVTPYVYGCFSHMPWAKFLDPVGSLEEHDKSVGSIQSNRPRRSTSDSGEIQTGDIVAIPSDANTKWKTKDKDWYAYVQGRKATKRGQQLRLIWVYRPVDTACQDMRYPHGNELFLSDHCNCGDGPIYAAEVTHKVRVVLFGSPEATTDAAFFVRQKYSTAESHWVTLKPSDFRCGCDDEVNTPLKCAYSVGDTLLVRTNTPQDRLEPVVLVGHTNKDSTLVRRLLRKRDDFGDVDADPNELVYSSRIDVSNVSTIVRRCYVRFYSRDDQAKGSIPAPYNRKGAGDCYYITWKQKHDSEELEAIEQPWPEMNQGFDPVKAAPKEPMRGLDIFCGGGNFGRGLEEGGAVRMEWAVDYFNEAIHTYHANASTKEPTKLFNGSVNEYLFDAIHGGRRTIIAQRGEVAIICAGSPCQGFSLANHLYRNDASLLNISLVASVVAFVDFYRPSYVMMENVPSMANCSGSGIRSGDGTGQSNVFAQVLCALLGLGYQVRPMLLDSWNFGAPQGRSRLFITAAAPSLTPLEIPAASHSHPSSVVGRSLGKTANGLPFGAREWIPTPFEYVTIGEATKDLPDNPDGRTACILCPDHRVTRSFSALDNVRLLCVPRFPPGMTFVKSVKLGWQPPPQKAAWHWDTKLRANINSKAWQRAKPNALLPTVTTENAPNDALTGSALHWDAHRQLTVMEARRAQGFPDEEVIIGSPAMQWKIIGNSVTRQVAIALGMSLREAWLASLDSQGQAQLLAEGGKEEDELVPTTLASKPSKLWNSTSRMPTTNGSCDAIESNSRESTIATVTVEGSDIIPDTRWPTPKIVI